MIPANWDDDHNHPHDCSKRWSQWDINHDFRDVHGNLRHTTYDDTHHCWLEPGHSADHECVCGKTLRPMPATSGGRQLR